MRLMGFVLSGVLWSAVSVANVAVAAYIRSLEQ